MLISAHGTQIVSKLRPADHLRQLLVDNGGADNDVIKAFFEMHTEVQAAATALVLACSQSVQDAQASVDCRARSSRLCSLALVWSARYSF